MESVVRILVEKDPQSGYWVGQCVEFDLVTQAKRVEDLPKAFGHVFFGELLLGLESGEQPLLRPCPPHIQEKWKKKMGGKTPMPAQLIPFEQLVPDWAPKAFSDAIARTRKLQTFQQPEQLVLAGC